MSLFHLYLFHFLSWSMGLLLDRCGLCLGVNVVKKALSVSVHEDNNNNSNNTTGTDVFVENPLPWPWPRDIGPESTQPTSGPRLNGTTSPSLPRPWKTPHRNASAGPSLQGSRNSTPAGVPISGTEKNSTKSSMHLGSTAPGMINENKSEFSSDVSSTTDPLGCFRDSYVLPRPLPELIADFRGVIDVSDTKRTISACATKARERGFKVFGIQFHTECWSGSGAENTYGRDGSSTDCQNGAGKSGANFVYKLRDFGNPSCPMYTNPRRLCFPGVSRVTLKSGLSIRMRQLQIGDRIKTLGTNGKPMFSEVIGFLHRETGSVAQFYSLEVKGGRVLRSSPQHLVFRKEKFASQTAVFASDIRLGDFLLISDKNVSYYRAVVRISMVTETGVYAPLTEQGSLLVDGVLVSCYAHWNSHHVAHLAMAPLRVLYRIQQTFQRFTGELGSTFWNSTEPNNGLSWYASTLVTITSLFITH